ncbi:hypothetical protein [Jiangella rhizosphaerae]|nr:hypothetical protein [Jiangella rhizosphaerae]
MQGDVGTAIWVRRAQRAGLSVLGAAAVLVGGAGLAAAADEPGGGGGLGGGLSWIDLEDEHGLSIWQYDLNLHRGSVTSPGKFVWSTFIESPWKVFQAFVAISAWLLRFALEFGWLRVIAAPFTSLADAVNGVMAEIGVGWVLLTVTAFVCMLWMARGMWALGVSELLISLVVASVAAGALASPMDRLIGDDGALYQARDVGLEVALDIADEEGAGGEGTPVPAHMSSLLVGTFVRLPHQIINYQTVFDGTDCEEVYNEAVAMQPLPQEAREPREHIRSCDEDAYRAADNPGAGQLRDVIILFATGLLILLLVVAIALSVILAALLALYQGLKAIVSLVVGVLPGRSRGFLWRNLADLVMALGLVAFASIFAAAFMVGLQAVFAATEEHGWHVMMTLFLVNLLLIVGVISVWRYHKAARRMGERLAEAMAGMRPGKATVLPDRSTAVRDVVKIGATVFGWRKLRQLTAQQQRQLPRREDAFPLSWPRDGQAPGGPGGGGTVTVERVPTGPGGPGSGPLPLGQPSGRKGLPAGTPAPSRPELGPGSGAPGGIPMPAASGGGAAAVAGVAARAALGAATSGASTVVLGGARAAGKAVGAARDLGRVLSIAGQTRRAQLLQRMTRAAGGTVPVPSTLPISARPVPVPAAPVGGTTAPARSPATPVRRPTPVVRGTEPVVRPRATTVVSRPLGNAAATVAPVRRRVERVVRPDGSVLFVPVGHSPAAGE